MTATVEKYGQIDVLVSEQEIFVWKKYFKVNNAGGGTPALFGKGITDNPISELDKMININVKPYANNMHFLKLN